MHTAGSDSAGVGGEDGGGLEVEWGHRSAVELGRARGLRYFIEPYFNLI
jgi:hypothetical protein